MFFFSAADWCSFSGPQSNFAQAICAGRDFPKMGTFHLHWRKNYSYAVVYIRFAGTHGEYDRVDAQEI